MKRLQEDKSSPVVGHRGYFITVVVDVDVIYGRRRSLYTLALALTHRNCFLLNAVGVAQRVDGVVSW